MQIGERTGKTKGKIFTAITVGSCTPLFIQDKKTWCSSLARYTKSCTYSEIPTIGNSNLNQEILFKVESWMRIKLQWEVKITKGTRRRIQQCFHISIFYNCEAMFGMFILKLEATLSHDIR